MAEDVITWVRIEPHAATTDIDVGLAAEVADPLWLLARQAQLGEFTGDDGGSPIVVEMRASYAMLSRYRAGPLPENGDGTAGQRAYDPRRAPLEQTIEAEPIDDARAWRARVASGQRLERDLRDAGLGAVVDRLRRACPLDVTVPETSAGPQERRYAAVFKGRVVDGVSVRGRLDAGLPADVVHAARDAAKLARVLDAWRAWHDEEMRTAPSSEVTPRAWQRDRLEYAFAVAAPAPDQGEVVLAAAEYDGSGLDWYHLDVAPGATLGAADDGAVPGARDAAQRRVLPKPVTFPGMPVDRFWEMEDGLIDLGTVDAGPTDLARLLATEYAVLYSPDWFVAPLELPLGCVARIDWVLVRDTFGVLTLVGTPETQTRDAAGRQFQPATTRDDLADVPLLFVPPAALYGQKSPPLEDVLVQRDEQANLVWVIERQVLGAAGRAVPAVEVPRAPDTRAANHDADLIYLVATSVPPHWSPLLARPVDDAPGAPLMLHRARLLDTPTGALRGSVGQLAGAIERLFEEEVTRAGVRLQLVDQLVRWTDGSTHIWRGRQKTAGLGESDARLFFDHAAARV